MSEPGDTGTISHVQLLLDSFARRVGRELVSRQGSAAEQAERLFRAPFVVVSHGTQADPVLNYGNAAALALWEMTWAEAHPDPLAADGRGGASRRAGPAPGPDSRARLRPRLFRDSDLEDRPTVSDRAGDRLEPRRLRGRAPRPGRQLRPLEAARARGLTRNGRLYTSVSSGGSRLCEPRISTRSPVASRSCRFGFIRPMHEPTRSGIRIR